MRTLLAYSICALLGSSAVVRASDEKCEGLPVDMIPRWGSYSSSPRIRDGAWVWAISKSGGTHRLRRVRARMLPVRRPNIDDSQGEPSGTRITTPDMSNTVLLLAGLKNPVPGRIPFVDLQETLVNDFDKPARAPRCTEFTFGRRAFTACAEVQRSGIWKRVRVYLTSEGTRQLLWSDDQASDAIAALVWLADIDRDGRPDLMLEASGHYATLCAKLFLSSAAGDGELVKEVACYVDGD